MGQSYELNHTPYEYSSEIELDKIKIKQIDSASDQSPQENEKFINSVNVEAQEQKKTPIDVKKNCLYHLHNTWYWYAYALEYVYDC